MQQSIGRVSWNTFFLSSSPLLHDQGSRRILLDAHSPNRVLCRYCVYRTDVKVESGMVEGGHWQRLNPRPSYTCFVNRTAACLRQIYALGIMSSIKSIDVYLARSVFLVSFSSVIRTTTSNLDRKRIFIEIDIFLLIEL